MSDLPSGIKRYKNIKNGDHIIMKKIFSVLVLSLLAFGAFAQQKGHFEMHEFDNFKLHIYYTNDVMSDASYIIEGKNTLVTLEQPLFKDNVAEYDAYLAKLSKPVEQRIADYHLGGTGNHPVVMPEGMPEFTSKGVYADMMKGFAQGFGDAIVSLPSGKKNEVAFGSTQTYANVPFAFYNGATTDFPGASILIGGKVWFSHWAPAKAHISHLQISSPAAIDAEIAESKKALQSGATLFIGGHGSAAKADAVQFKIDYLNAMKKLLAENKTPEAFTAALEKAYPDLPGVEGLGELAKALYK